MRTLNNKWEQLTNHVWVDYTNDIVLIMKKDLRKYSMLDGNEIIMVLNKREYEVLLNERRKNQFNFGEFNI